MCRRERLDQQGLREHCSPDPLPAWGRGGDQPSQEQTQELRIDTKERAIKTEKEACKMP
jgi:hypothetical protein